MSNAILSRLPRLWWSYLHLRTFQYWQLSTTSISSGQNTLLWQLPPSTIKGFSLSLNHPGRVNPYLQNLDFTNNDIWILEVSSGCLCVFLKECNVLSVAEGVQSAFSRGCLEGSVHCPGGCLAVWSFNCVYLCLFVACIVWVALSNIDDDVALLRHIGLLEADEDKIRKMRPKGTQGHSGHSGRCAPLVRPPGQPP